MGNQCACQKIESEDEILSRIIGNIKLREIETKCVYHQFLNCVDSDDMIIDYFSFSNFISQIIGNNFYKIPLTNYFENLRKRSDYLYANLKAIGIILILFSNGDEKTKINFIVEYFFSFFGKLNEKTVKEFLGYIIDSQTDNCIFSFKEIYSYESIKAFREIYSRSRRKVLINIIFENFESVKFKYIGKMFLNKKNENSLILISPASKKIRLSKYKRKAESLANSRNSIRNKLIKGFSIYNSRLNYNENKDSINNKHKNIYLSKTNSLMSSKKRVNFCMENKQSLATLNYYNQNDSSENFYSANISKKYIEMNYVKNSSLKSSLNKSKEIGINTKNANESLIEFNINATKDINIRKFRNKIMNDFKHQKTNLLLTDQCLSNDENPISKKFSFAKISIKEESQDSNNFDKLDSCNNIVYKICNSDDKITAKFKSESDKSSKNNEMHNNNSISQKLNDKVENFNYINKNNSEKNIINNGTNINNNDNDNSDTNEISFSKKKSSDNNYNLIDRKNFNIQSNKEKKQPKEHNLNSISIDEKSSINEKLADNKEKKISLENDKININLDTSKVISVDRMSFYSNENNDKNYEKYNKGQSDKKIKNSKAINMHHKNPICLTEEKEEKKIKKTKITKKEELTSNKIMIDPEALEKEIIRNPELSQKIFTEFLELSFQFFNGDTIRNWLYDNFLREKLHQN